MYGMVNLAIQELLCRRYGTEIWENIRSQFSIPTEQVFLTVEQYPDELSTNILTAASGLIGRPLPQLLEELGEYWIPFAQRSGYGELLGLLGGNLFEALGNLDNLHMRVGLAFPELQPPSFWVTDVQGNTFMLHYHSQRAGFAPMVPGLVKGLGEYFNQDVRINELNGSDAHHHVFTVFLSNLR